MLTTIHTLFSAEVRTKGMKGTSKIISLLAVLLGPWSQYIVEAQGLEYVTSYLNVPEEAPLAGVFIHDEIAYVGGHSTGYFTSDNIGVRIVDLSDPGNSQLVSRIPVRRWDLRRGYSVGMAVAGDLDTEHFKGTIAVVTNGVPDTYTLSEFREPHGVWDVTDPANPKFLSIFGEGKDSFVAHGDLGFDYPKLGTALVGNYYYYLYLAQARGSSPARTDCRLGIVDLSDPFHPAQVGSWQDNSDVVMEGVYVNASGTRAYLTAIWPKPFGLSATHTGVYIVDVSDPTAPQQIGHWGLPERDAGNSISSAYIARATADDNLVVYTDGSWGKLDEDKHGILHILDTSDPSNIVKISEFDAEKENPRGGWNTAVNVSIRGSTAYSAWLNGGVVAFDISDPANPKMTGQYIANFITDAVPLGDEYVVASPAWEAGLHILRDENASRSPTQSEVESSYPERFALYQNYPNPFSTVGGGTQISFELPETTSARLAVFDVTGREVAVLVDETLSAGRHTVRFAPDGLPGGVYLYRLETGSFQMVRRAVVMGWAAE